MYTPGLVFDLGMHKALDTSFYLSKGFSVVSLEANPTLAAAGAQAHAAAVASGKLVVVDKALWEDDGSTISFFLNAEKDDWSSAFKPWAEKGGHATTEIKVPTTTVSGMFDTHGVPYFIKCDIEGADDLFVRQLLADGRRPAFVSIEAVSLEALAMLYACGYDRVQIVNQAFNGFTNPPNPAREGAYVPQVFNGHMSGLFGKELPEDGWKSFSEAAENYIAFLRLQKRDPMLAHGWLDFHVTSSSVLGTDAAA
jgi:FkbM family methyltransferase